MLMKIHKNLTQLQTKFILSLLVIRPILISWSGRFLISYFNSDKIMFGIKAYNLSIQNFITAKTCICPTKTFIFV